MGLDSGAGEEDVFEVRCWRLPGGVYVFRGFAALPCSGVCACAVWYGAGIDEA